MKKLMLLVFAGFLALSIFGATTNRYRFLLATTNGTVYWPTNIHYNGTNIDDSSVESKKLVNPIYGNGSGLSNLASTAISGGATNQVYAYGSTPGWTGNPSVSNLVSQSITNRGVAAFGATSTNLITDSGSVINNVRITNGVVWGNGAGMTNLNWVLTNANTYSAAQTFSNVSFPVGATVYFSNNITRIQAAGLPHTQAGGAFFDFHRPGKTNWLGLRFFNDDDGIVGVDGLPSYFFIGPDMAYPGASFMAWYDNVLGVDTLRMGMTNTLRGHLGIAAAGLWPNYTMGVADLAYDPDLTNITDTVYIQSLTNGIRWYTSGNKADGITFIRANNATQSRWIHWEQGSRAEDWRIGWIGDTTYDLVFMSRNGVAGGSASDPGTEKFRLNKSMIYSSVPILSTNSTYGFIGNGSYLTNVPGVPCDGLIPANRQYTVAQGYGINGAFAGWVGVQFKVINEDMLIRNVGRYITESAITNNQYLMYVIDNTAGITNWSITMPRTVTKDRWMWADMNLLLTKDNTYSLMIQTFNNTDGFNAAVVPPSWDSSTTNRVACYSSTSPSSGLSYPYTNYLFGLVNYLR